MSPQIVARDGEKLNLVIIRDGKIQLWGYSSKRGRFFYCVRKLQPNQSE